MSGLLAGLEDLWRFAVPHITEPASPAAGANYSLALDGKYWWRLRMCSFTLTTSATAANRFCSVQMLMADQNPIVIGAAAVVVTASSSNQRFDGSSRRGTSEWNTGTDVLFPLDDYAFLGGRTLTINVANIQTGDQLSLIKLAWLRLPTDADVVAQFAGAPAS